MTTVRSPFRLASTAVRNERFPELGADTVTVLAEMGCSAEDIEQLLTSGVAHDRLAEDIR